jgi:hypothetical protein
MQYTMQYTTKDSGKRETFDTGSQRDTQEGKGRYDLIPWLAIKRWAIKMEQGAERYGERNWEKGQPLARYYNSAIRHMSQWFDGQKDEDHLAAALFNIGAAMWTEEQIFLGRLPKELDTTDIVGVKFEVEYSTTDHSGWGSNETWQAE